MQISRKQLIRLVKKQAKLHFFRGKLDQIERDMPYLDSNKYYNTAKADIVSKLKELDSKNKKKEVSVVVSKQYIER
jgi:hypothetical protein